MKETGRLIVLESVDDAALLHLAEGLCRWLRQHGLDVEHTREPTYGPAGTQILLAQQGRLRFEATSLALLYLADRLDHVQHADGIESWLAAGRHVICTHYSLAAAASLWGQVGEDWLHRIDVLSRVPDLTLFVDLPATRVRQQNLQQGYRAAIQHMHNYNQEVLVIDGNQAPEQVQLVCQNHLARLLNLNLSPSEQGV
jgi:thymidylate kinase